MRFSSRANFGKRRRLPNGGPTTYPPKFVPMPKSSGRWSPSSGITSVILTGSSGHTPRPAPLPRRSCFLRSWRPERRTRYSSARSRQVFRRIGVRVRHQHCLPTGRQAGGSRLVAGKSGPSVRQSQSAGHAANGCFPARKDPPTLEELDRVNMSTSTRCRLATLLALRFPQQKERFAQLAKKLNISHGPPYYLVERALR